MPKERGCMKKMQVLSALFSCVFLFSSSIYASLSVSVGADSAILIDAKTGCVLFEKKADKLQYPASITKLATATYLLSKNPKWKKKIKAGQKALGSISSSAKIKSNYKKPAYWIEQGSSHIGIKVSEELSLESLFYAMMLASANDAANVIAEELSGDLSKFSADLNAYLKSLGCKSTHFLNAHGLHHPLHRTTARDMSIIAREALKSSFLREVVKTVRYQRPKTNKQEAVWMLQTNQLLRKGKFYYPKAFGVKTGYTQAARASLVAAAKDKDRELIAVVLRSKEKGGQYRDVRAMFERAFEEEKETKTLVKKGLQKNKRHFAYSGDLRLYAKESLLVSYYPSEKPHFRAKLYWEKLELPIQKGERVARVELYNDKGTYRKTWPLFAANDLREGMLKRAFRWFSF